ncbi:hypothetical protein Y032_0328g2640 [Ancylostoma ceylanicum]|nr:hypothetical protein Y032_0328g2640 [Ancylostoma ceylanicum]
MAHMMSKRRLRVTEADERYRFTSRVAWPKKWSSEPASYLQTLSWWRKNFSNNLTSSATNDYLNRNTLGEEPKGSTTSTVKPRPPLPSCKKDENTADTSTPTSSHGSRANVRRPPQAGPRSTGKSVIHGASTGKGKRKFGEGATRDHESPPPKSHASVPAYNTPHFGGSSAPVRQYVATHSAERPRSPNSWSRPAAPAVPPAGTDPCALCSSRQHYTSDCTEYPWLSVRASMAEKYNLCSNCAKQHYGDCVRKDACSCCHKPGHHRTFCVKNTWAKLDIRMPAEQFYAELAQRTYRPPPPGAHVRHPHVRSRHDHQ